MEDLLSEDPARREQAKQFLSLLEEGAAPCLVRVLKRSDNPRQRRQAADLLKMIGEPAKKFVSAEIHVGNSTDTLLRILSVLDDFISPELAVRFEAMAHFPDSAVRRRMVQLLAKIPGSGASAALRFLDDADESIQIEAIRATGESKNREAVSKLVEMLRDGSTRRLEETCLALGQIRDERAVSGLGEILEPKSSGFFKRKSAPEETVRVRAAWALSQIPGSTARDILTRIAKDPNLQIQSIARQALSS
jgi:HEAT repeat protein